MDFRQADRTRDRPRHPRGAVVWFSIATISILTSQKYNMDFMGWRAGRAGRAGRQAGGQEWQAFRARGFQPRVQFG